MSWDAFVQWVKDNGTAGSAIIAAAVAIILFLLTRIVEMIGAWRGRRATRRRIVVGLYKEVQFNVGTIERFLDLSPYPGDLREKVRTEPTFRPLLIIDETTQFYDSIAASLPEVDSDCLIALSQFYEKIRKQHAIADAFESAAFATISPEGKAGTVDDLWRACRQAEKEGWKALYELELNYPRAWFSDFRS